MGIPKLELALIVPHACHSSQLNGVWPLKNVHKLGEKRANEQCQKSCESDNKSLGLKLLFTLIIKMKGYM
jgi:hypothetical protein